MLPARDAPTPNHRATFGDQEVAHRNSLASLGFWEPPAGTSPCAVPAAAGGCGCGGGGSDDSGDNEADEKEERSG